MKAIDGICVMILFLLIATSLISKVNAQPYFSVYPTEGTVNTDIFLQVRGLPGSGFYEIYYLYLFWDGTLLRVYPDNQQTYDHWFDIHFFPPNSSIQTLGNHTVYFEVWNDHRTAMFLNATFVFTITGYFPGPEYITLNATYYQLLANYTALNATYMNLQSQYNALVSNYNSLLSDYNNLLTQYNSLLANYDSLSNNYNALSANFNNLQGSYNALNDHYNSLQGNYNSLSSDYNDLESQYDSLQTDYTFLRTTYTNLEGDYVTLAGELTTARILNDVLIVTTLVFVALTAYLIAKRKK